MNSIDVFFQCSHIGHIAKMSEMIYAYTSGKPVYVIFSSGEKIKSMGYAVLQSV